MASVRRGRVFGFLVGGALSFSSPLLRAADSEPIRIDYRAEAGCPDGAAFFRTVRARTSRVRETGAGEPARTFHVTIGVDETGAFHGELSVSESGSAGGTAPRTISGPSCAEIFDALTLFTALSVDPQASTAKFPVEAETSAPGVTTAAVSTTPAPSVARPAEQRAPEAGRRADEQTSELRALFGAYAGVMTAGTPTPLVVVAPFIEAGLHARATRGAFVAPTFRLAFVSTGTRSEETASGWASLHWTTFRLDACPLELRIAKVLSGRPCATASAGVFRASGQDIAHPDSERLFWAALGALARTEWEVWGPFSLEISGGVDFPLRRDSFHFQPDTPVYRVPPGLAHVEAAAWFRFL